MAPRSPELSHLLQRQHGVVTRAQARDLGMSDADVRRMIRTGRWERVAPAIYGVTDHRATWARRLWIAHLHAGSDSVVSHESAGRLHRYRQVPANLVTLTVASHRRAALPHVRHRVANDLDLDQITSWHGLPITTEERTIVDLSSALHIASLRSLVEDLVTEHRFSVARIGAELARVRRRGKPGMANLARVLDDLGPGGGLPRSELERLLDGVIAASAVPSPVHEYPLPGRGAVTGFVDRCWPEAKLIVEGDGRKWHTRRAQASLDATRTLEAQAVGYETTRLLWEHLAHDADGTATLLRAVHDQRRRLLDRRSA